MLKPFQLCLHTVRKWHCLLAVGAVLRYASLAATRSLCSISYVIRCSGRYPVE